MSPRWLLFLLLFVLGCSNGPTSSDDAAEPEPEPSAVEAIVRELEARGASVDGVGPVSQPFLSTPGEILRVNGEDVQLFEYGTVAQAEADAARVSPDGSVVGSTFITWIAPPHFYREGPVIVLYVGSSAELLSLLDSILGPPFAGG